MVHNSKENNNNSQNTKTTKQQSNKATNKKGKQEKQRDKKQTKEQQAKRDEKRNTQTQFHNQKQNKISAQNNLTHNLKTEGAKGKKGKGKNTAMENQKNGEGEGYAFGIFTKRTTKEHEFWRKLVCKHGVKRIIPLFLKITKGTLPQSRRTRLGHLISVLKRIGKYEVLRIKLKDLAKHLQRESVGRVREPLAIKKEHVLALVRRAPSTEIRLLLALMWATASRPMDLLRVEKRDVHIKKEKLAILFRQSKSAILTGQPYTIHVHCPKLLRNLLLTRLATKSKMLFSVGHLKAYKTIRTMAKEINKQYDMRSFRRGALSKMAEYLSLEDLLLISRHRDTKTLYRYLNWGLNATFIFGNVIKQTQHLWTTKRE